ncbi:RNA polymerase sigma factor [Reichenbachiella sp. MALMAid0571]|uniref:RNA polymerase sigma factor n=1 Tax=Reichenbachiella sp. MALMAid0571 TaxID=3143939 RepID=UPI0032DE7BAD
MAEISEQALINGIAEGDEDAFKFLVHKYQNMVFNTSLGFLPIKEDAEEITQDVFVEVFKSINSFRQDATLKTWVYRITISKCLEFQRKAKRKKRFAFLVSIGNTSDTIIEPKVLDHPGVEAENQERTELLYKQIDQLPDNQKIALVLHNMDGMSYKDISNTMNISLSSVESLIFRAKKNLKKKLSHYYEQML